MYTIQWDQRLHHNNAVSEVRPTLPVSQAGSIRPSPSETNRPSRSALFSHRSALSLRCIRPSQRGNTALSEREHREFRNVGRKKWAIISVLKSGEVFKHLLRALDLAAAECHQRHAADLLNLSQDAWTCFIRHMLELHSQTFLKFQSPRNTLKVSRLYDVINWGIYESLKSPSQTWSAWRNSR